MGRPFLFSEGQISAIMVVPTHLCRDNSGDCRHFLLLYSTNRPTMQPTFTMTALLRWIAPSWCLLLTALLVASALAPATVQAQEVQLRLVHAGTFLPEGTAVAILEEAADPSASGRLQPRFMDAEDHPRNPASISFRDTLNAQSRTANTYAQTQPARTLYFLYARTPDDEIYWSYSAQEQQLKFDVVQTGTMSMAPVTDEEIANDLRDRFFRPEEEDESEAIADAAEEEIEEPPRPEDAIDSPDEDEVEAGEEQVATDPAEPAPADTDAPAESWLVPVLLGMLLLALVLLFLLYRRYSQIRSGVSSEDVLQAELAAAKEQLREYRHMEAEYKALQKKYETVRQHCDTLLQQHDRMREKLEEAGYAPNEPKGSA